MKKEIWNEECMDCGHIHKWLGQFYEVCPDPFCSCKKFKAKNHSSQSKEEQAYILQEIRKGNYKSMDENEKRKFTL